VAYIDAHKGEYGVEPICKVLQVAPSTYYAAKTRPPSARSVSDAATTAVITKVHAENYGVYGITKVHAALRRNGHRVARCTVHRLMRAAGLRGIIRAKGPRTTVAGTGPETRPDLVERSFTAAAPDRLWVADITYCRTFAGWVYAAFVIDVFSRRVVGWQLSTSLRTDLALDALEMGLWTRSHDGHDTSGVVHHSDKGVQGGFNRSSQHPQNHWRHGRWPARTGQGRSVTRPRGHGVSGERIGPCGPPCALLAGRSPHGRSNASSGV